MAEMTDDLDRAKSYLAECKKEERSLAKQIALIESAASEWQQRAMSAMRAGDDVVAKDALARKSHHDREVAQLRASHREKVRDAETMTKALVGLTKVILEPKMPLAKTQVGEATRGKGSPRDRAKVAGQKRTKR